MYPPFWACPFFYILLFDILRDDIDIDALVEAVADARHGDEMSNRQLTKLHELERDIAVMFMADMGGSTK